MVKIKKSKNIISKYISSKTEKEIVIRSIKILDITYITFVYGLITLFIVTLLDKYVYKYISFQKVNKEKDKNFYLLLLEILICLTINSIIFYFLRNLLEFIPFPLQGVYGFNHFRVKEVESGMIISFILIWFSKILREKLIALQSKIS
jgi:hypothetical protein